MKPSLETKSGFTLVEVVVATLLVTLLGAGVIQSTLLARKITYSNAQRVAAFGLAKAKTEELKGVGYEKLTATYGTTHSETDLELVNLGGVNQELVKTTRTTTLEDLTSPRRKRVTVSITWDFQGKELEESAEIFLYPRR